MDSKTYLALNAWLQKADTNYIEGRLLFLNLCINGACNLLWLACEQMIKILILQIDDEKLKKFNDLNEVHEYLDKQGRKISHKVSVSKLQEEYNGLDLEKHKSMLDKLNEYFYRRYAQNSSSFLSLDLLNEADEFYFLLRSRVKESIGVGTIDEIFIQKKHGWGHPLKAFEFAYLKNQYFKPRKHFSINQMGIDGKIYKESGNLDVVQSNLGEKFL